MTQKKVDAKDKIKARMKKQVDATNEKVALFNGEKDKIGKFKLQKTGTSNTPKSTEADLDKFFRSAEEGFRDIKAVAKEDKKPYDGLLGRVEIERVVKTINK